MKNPRFAPLLAVAALAAAFLLLAEPISAATGGTAAGVKWTVPGTWTEQAARPMRVVTYTIPGAKGAEAGECGVFYFGKGQGGSPDENAARWAGQFEGGATPKSSVETVNGFKVHRIRTSGTYLAPGGPMMKSQGKKPGWQLSGAIVEAPEGNVFFKCVGPEKTIAAAEADIDALLKSLKKTMVVKY
ncbi:MAG TPA: hypothetical protein VE007_11630 [Thermoanaerobaculia bacterium]|nr:hypothetical protein [Thermoanaerobaculia bacterium]